MNDPLTLQTLCKQVRHHILSSTTTAGSGHPTSSLSAVELMTALFFGGFFKYDINNPHSILNDSIIFSKGHASPLLYALWTVAGVISKEELMTLRQFGSRLEGHPTPSFPYIDVATGSLGQGLSVGVGMALALKNTVSKAQTLNPKSQSNSKSQISNGQNNLGFRVSDLEFSKILPRIFVLLGDSELAEGQNWEALEIASHYKLNNLVGILDVNRLGQRGETMLGWDLETYQKRIESFGWNTIVIDDGHDIKNIMDAFNEYGRDVINPLRPDNRNEASHVSTNQLPTMFIAHTVKGKGVSFLENQDGWHGKPVPKKRLQEALLELGEIDWSVKRKIQQPTNNLSLRGGNKVTDEAIPSACLPARQRLPRPFGARNDKNYSLTSTFFLSTLCSTREAYGDALVSLGKQYEQIVVLDAETSNSTFTDRFKKVFPNRFFEMFIAEQNMVSVALGFSTMGYVPFVSSFAAFLTRAFDQIRMAQYSISTRNAQRVTQNVQTEKNVTRYTLHDIRFEININLVGSHAGCSIGPDGASQMALEDIAMMRSIRESTVLYPSDAVSTAKLTSLLIDNPGISYLRLTREKTPVIYDEREEFKIGGLKIIQMTNNKLQITNQIQITNNKYSAVIIAAGITLHEALKAQKQLAEKGMNVIVVDLYSIKPLDEKTFLELAKQTSHIIVVEDHYPAGGIGEAVFSFLTTIDPSNLLRVNQQPTTQPHFTHLCVKKLPHSGTPEELLRYEEIDAEAIIKSISSH